MGFERPGWRPYPGADGIARRLPVESGRVVGIGALCDVATQPNSFSVAEFVALDDGRRVLLHEERGFTISGHIGSAEILTRQVLNVVLPDDDDVGEEHPWTWLAGLARARGLEVTPEHLRGLPYEVVLSERTLEWLKMPA